MLHQVLREHLPGFIRQVEEAGGSVPLFVQRELESVITCGVIEHGVTHWKCTWCGLDRVLPFSCRSRLCPTCAGRRMNDTAKFWVESVFPSVPVRQFVLTFPPPLRYLLAYDAELASRVISIFIQTLFRWQRRKAKRLFDLESITQAHPGAVTAIQRAGSAANLNWHLHSLAFDGVFVETDPNAAPRFRALPAPSKGEVQSLAWEICRRTTEMLQKQGRYLDADPAESDSLAQDEPLLAASYAASLQQVVAIGDRAGERVERRRILVDSSQRAAESQLVAGHGFDLHAQVRIPARDRKRLQRLARYILRPPIAYDRLSRTPDGKVVYELKKTWSDGTRALVFDPRDFLSKLAAILPRPRTNMIRYYGILAPAARLRSAVVPKTEGDRREQSGPVQLGLDIEGSGISGAGPGGGGSLQNDSQRQAEPGGKRKPRKPTPFAELMAHTFDIDPNCCPRCRRGKMRLVRVVTDPASIARLMASLGTQRSSPEPPMASSAPTRGPPWPQQLVLPLAGVADAAADRRAA